MLQFLPIFTIAQVPTPTPVEVLQPQQVRPPPGQLDTVPVFNSNSPELVLNEGILLSTFPSEGKQSPAAHLNFPFLGRFDIFAHHVARAPEPGDLRTLYQGIIVNNPGTRPVQIDILQAASYLSQPDAPFIELGPVLDNTTGMVFAGPGSRVMSDVLRVRRQNIFPSKLVIPPGVSQMIMNLPIPVATLTPPLNGRSTLMRLRSNGRIYLASLAMFAPREPNGMERAPNVAEWQNLLDKGKLSEPRDSTPTPLEQTSKVVYGRVAGVAQGSQWTAQLVDNPKSQVLNIPQPGQAFSYGLSTLHLGRLGTGQNQSARMLVRYPDTAYEAHGNYGIHYNLSLPLVNNTPQPQTVAVTIQTPIKEDQLSKPGLRFFNPPQRQVFFRGTVRLRYNDDQSQPQTRFVHLVQRRGQQGEPLVLLSMKPGERRLVEVDFLYPPDATPPQVLTVKTLVSSQDN